MKVIFAGTPDFAAHHLSALIESEHEIVAVLTQPDRPAGRGRKVSKSAVKINAEQHSLPIHQPQKLKNNGEITNLLAAYQADIMVVVAYGLILPEAVLSLPKYGCLNVHASLLPRWRGSAPIHRAIESGDKKSGVCIMQMNKGLDTGDVLTVAETIINDDDNLQILHDRLANLGSKALLETLTDYHNIKAQPQDDRLANYAEKISKAETLIDWQQDSRDIFNKIRAFCPWPIATTHHKDIVLRVWQSSTESAKNKDADDIKSDNQLNHAKVKLAKSGQILAINKKYIAVKAADDVVYITSIQKPGSKAMNIHNFINGYNIEVGDFFE